MIKKDITSIAIGGFDGMHLAHQELFKKLDSNGAIVVICTGYANLTIQRYRERHTSFPLFFYPLEDIKHLSGEQFINLLQEEFPKLQKIVVGYDFQFGNQALYNTDDLKKLFPKKVEVVDEFKIDGIAIHSRIIRQHLSNGSITKANQLLGYPYMVVGYPIKGQGLGQKQFVPTINLDIQDFLIPSEGVYITQTLINHQKINSVTFIGHRKTTDGKFAVETHLIDTEFQENIPHTIEIHFFKQIRKNQKFEHFKILKQQILNDIKNAKKYFYEEQKK